MPNPDAPTELQRQQVLVEIARRALGGAAGSSLGGYAGAALAAALDVPAVMLLQPRPDGGFEVVDGDALTIPPSGACSVELRLALRSGHTAALSDGALGELAALFAAARAAARAAEPDATDDLPGARRPLASAFAEAPPRLGLGVPVEGAGPYVLVALRAEPVPFTDPDQAFLHTAAELLTGARQRQATEHALRRSEAQARAILSTTVDGIITIDERGAIQTMNPAAERIFGYTIEEVLGCNVKVLMPPPYREEHDGYMASYHETGRRRIIGIGREVSGRRKDGTTFPMELSVSEVRTLDGTRTFTGLVRDITDRRELEAEVLRIADEERRRIGQDLHDGLGQMLTGTHLIARGLARQLEADGSARAADAVELAGLIKEADGYARALARGLVPVELEAHGLAAALKRLAANAERLFGVACSFELVGSGAGDVGEAPEVPAAAHLFRIAQEAVSNAVQHGRANHIAITLAVGADRVRLRIDDDGVGVGETIRSGGYDAPRSRPPAGQGARDTTPAPTVRPDENRGMGVRIMHYRARIAQGSLELRPGTDGGTTVSCTVPLH